MVVAQAPGRHPRPGARRVSGLPQRARSARAAPARAESRVPMDIDGWDLDAVGRIARQARPRLAYLIPDFQNPTGNLMGNAQREQYAALLRRTGHRPGRGRVARAAGPGRVAGCHVRSRRSLPDTITLGSASKSLWGGLRSVGSASPLGAGRASRGRPRGARPGQPGARAAGRRPAARPPRGALVGPTALGCARSATPSPTASGASSRTGVSGSRAAGCRCGASCRPHGRRRGAIALAAEAERRGVVVSPGPVFAVDGGLDSFVRVPFTRPADELRDAVDRLARRVGGCQRAADGDGVDAPATRYHRRTRAIWSPERPGGPGAAGLRPGRRARSEVASMAGSISASASARDRGVDRQRDQRVAALGVAGDLHAGDVDRLSPRIRPTVPTMPGRSA